jgi:hypothetical protein
MCSALPTATSFGDCLTCSRKLHFKIYPTKTGSHDIAEILLKVTLKHQKSKKSNQNI